MITIVHDPPAFAAGAASCPPRSSRVVEAPSGPATTCVLLTLIQAGSHQLLQLSCALTTLHARLPAGDVLIELYGCEEPPDFHVAGRCMNSLQQWLD